MKIAWEYDLVERPFCGQLEAMGWQWIEGDIITHELAHLNESHHGPAFWRTLGRALPDWQRRKESLAGSARDYLVFDLPAS